VRFHRFTQGKAVYRISSSLHEEKGVTGSGVFIEAIVAVVTGRKVAVLVGKTSPEEICSSIVDLQALNNKRRKRIMDFFISSSYFKSRSFNL